MKEQHYPWLRQTELLPVNSRQTFVSLGTAAISTVGKANIARQWRRNQHKKEIWNAAAIAE